MELHPVPGLTDLTEGSSNQQHPHQHEECFLLKEIFSTSFILTCSSIFTETLSELMGVFTTVFLWLIS